eukprot:3872336-Rhodomonas_salina.1
MALPNVPFPLVQKTWPRFRGRDRGSWKTTEGEAGTEEGRGKGETPCFGIESRGCRRKERGERWKGRDPMPGQKMTGKEEGAKRWHVTVLPGYSTGPGEGESLSYRGNHSSLNQLTLSHGELHRELKAEAATGTQ